MQIRIYNKRVSFDSSKGILFIFFIFGVALYYPGLLFLSNISYIALFLGAVNKVQTTKRIENKEFIYIVLLFVSFSALSFLWAIDPLYALDKSASLAKMAFLSILLAIYIDSIEMLKYCLFWLALSGIVYTLMFFLYLGPQLSYGRIEYFDDSLPNPNVVGLIISFSFIYFLFLYSKENLKIALMPAILSILFIFALGSRRTIISIIIGIILLVRLLPLKRKAVFLILLLFMLIVIMILIPREYISFILDRSSNMFSSSTLDDSDLTRILLLERGVEYILYNPIFGNGYYNFSILFEADTGSNLYSHNNYIETLVGGGCVLFVIYYLLYFIPLKHCKLCPKRLDYKYLILIIIVMSLFNHFGIVVINNRFTWYLLPVIYASTRLLAKEKYK